MNFQCRNRSAGGVFDNRYTILQSVTGGYSTPHPFVEKGNCVTAVGLIGINRVKRLKVYNIGATTLTKIAST